MHLKNGAVLKRGEYRIEKLLGQGGFGITYLAVQSGLDRKVAIKEFFMKDLCERDADTSSVTLGTSGSRQTVIRFKEKFIREAKTIASLRHPNIVNIHDVFEENGTAYYVMEYHDGGSLSSLDLPLSVEKASGYVCQIASALSYLHKRNTMHLDVKPSNILLDESGNAVLIDFGVSKHYDQAGHQTSSTPVGISHGYAPGEQYQQNTLSFSPTTDIYALGATFYKLLTGLTPPHQNEVAENGLPVFPSSVPESVASVIDKAMQPRRKDRPQSIEEFLGLLDAALTSPSSDKIPSDTADLEIVDAMPTENTELGPELVPETGPVPSPKKPSRKWLWWLLALFVAVVGAAAVLFMGKDAQPAGSSETPREVPGNSVDQPPRPQHELDKEKYDSLLNAASKVSLSDLASYDKAIGLYEQAKGYEERYNKKEHASSFAGNSQSKIDELEAAKEKLMQTMSEGDQAKSDAQQYADLMEMGAEYEEKDEYLEQAREKYSKAEKIEENWSKTKYSDMFVQKAASAVERVEKKILELEERDTKFNNDLKDYTKKIREANGKSRNDESSLKTAKQLYEAAAKYEKQYENTKYASSFNAGAATLAKNMQDQIDALPKPDPTPVPSPIPEPEPTPSSITGTHKGHAWVDLGLPSGLKWATCNVGASSPEEYGDYFAWGETKTKSTYTEDNSASYESSDSKWNNIGGNSRYDAARANWGGDWRMPTEDEFQELLDNCTWEWTTQNGHNGYKVTGPNGNSIFLPAAGDRYGADESGVGSTGYYWSSTPLESNTLSAYRLFFLEDHHSVGWSYRYRGRSVRSVLE